MVQRVPSVPLNAWVRVLWASGAGLSSEPAPRASVGSLERVLPTGHGHLVLRLGGPALRLVEGGGFRVVSPYVVGGPRSMAYLKARDEPCTTLGAQLLPGASFRLFGVSARELAETHTPLEDLLGRSLVSSWAEQLSSVDDASARLRAFEGLLVGRLGAAPPLHQAVRRGLQELDAGRSVRDAVSASGYSHRRFIALFHDSTGFSPKRWTQLRRFGVAVEEMGKASGLSQLARWAGYSDQAHLTREFRRFAGLTPGQHRTHVLKHPFHVPELMCRSTEVNFVQDGS